MTLKKLISEVAFYKDLLPLYKKQSIRFDDIYADRQLLDELQQLEPTYSSEEIVVTIWSFDHTYYIVNGLEGSFQQILGKQLRVEGEFDKSTLIKTLLFFIKDKSSSSDGFYPIRYATNKSSYSLAADKLYHRLVERYTYNCESLSYDEFYDVFLHRQSHANRIKNMRDRRIQLKINKLMQQHRASKAIDLINSLNAKTDPQDFAFLIECNQTLEDLFRPYPSGNSASLEDLIAYTQIPIPRGGRSLATVYYGKQPDQNRAESIRSLLASFGPFSNFVFWVGSSESLPEGREFLFVVIGD